jgi:hypothetical protein
MNNNQANRWILTVIIPFCALGINAQDYTAGVSGYTVIDSGPWSTVRNETGTNKVVMPTVSKNSTNAVQASGSAARSFYSHDDSQQGASATSPFQGAFISGYAAAEPGLVHAWARNSAVASPPAILDPDGVPYLPSAFTVVASITVGSGTDDFLTIGSTNLPQGTPINFTWHTYAEGYRLETGYNPYRGFGNTEAQLNYLVYFVCGSISDAGDTRDFFGGGFDYVANGAGSSFKRDGSLQFSAKVGDTVPVYLSIGIQGEAAVDAVNSQRGIVSDWSSGAAVDMSHTAYMWFSDIPSGVQFSSGSGHDYTVRPNFAPIVPEVPVLTAYFVADSSQVELCWKSQTNMNYQVQSLMFPLSSSPNQWIDLGVPVQGNGLTNCFNDLVDGASMQRTYRLVVFP